MSDAIFGALPSAALRELTGLELMQGIAEGRLPAMTIARTLNFTLVAAEHGRVTFRGTPLADAMNPMGSTHGGWYGAILDSCMGSAVISTLPVGRGFTTLEYRISIIRPIRPGETEVEAVGSVSHAGRRTAVAEGRLSGVEDGKLYATSNTTCLILDPKA